MTTSDFEFYKNLNNTIDLENHFKNLENWHEFIADVRDLAKSILSTDRVFDNNEATIVGLMVNMYKIYDVVVDMFIAKKKEPLLWLQRSFFESQTTIKYLIKKGEKSQRHYRIISYKNRYNFLRGKAINDVNLLQFNIVVSEKLRRDGFKMSDLENEGKSSHFKWKLDGKNFEQILDSVKENEIIDNYLLNFRFSSESAHGSWQDSINQNLMFETNTYKPIIEFDHGTSNELIVYYVQLLIKALIDYIDWMKDSSFDNQINKLYTVSNYFSQIKKEPIFFFPVKSVIYNK